MGVGGEKRQRRIHGGNFVDDYDSDDDDYADDNNQMNKLGDKFASFSLVCFISLRFPRKDIFQWIH